MPTEYRFDDLDLREQPARRDGPISDIVSYPNQTCASLRCQTDYCTEFCCTNGCPTQHA